MKLLFGTSNPGKVREFAELLALPGFEICSLSEFPDLARPDEDADTFLANARRKAEWYSGQTRLPTVADDSGLEVEALGGDPGVRSARLAGDGAADRANVDELLRRLAAGAASRIDRSRFPGEIPGYRLLSPARFVCALSLFTRGKEHFSAQGTCHGFITAEPKGDNGFGYDPVFFVPAQRRTMAEMSAADKGRTSHRGAAVRRLREFLLHHPAITG